MEEKLIYSPEQVLAMCQIPAQIETNCRFQASTNSVTTPSQPRRTFCMNKYEIVEEDQNYCVFRAYSPQAANLAETEPNCAVLKSVQCVNLFTRLQFMKYSKPLIKFLIEINRKNQGLPPSLQLDQENEQIWQNVDIKYPRHVLRYKDGCYSSQDSVIYVITEDYSQYKPLIYYIQRARLANKGHTSSVSMTPTIKESTSQPDNYNNVDCLNQTQILVIISKVLQALSDLFKLEGRFNEENLGLANLFDQQKQFYSQQRGDRYMSLFKFFNPEHDILVHPQTLDVKLYNFGLKEDLDICTYEYKKELTDSNFIYRHPSNVYFQTELPSDKKERYISKYILKGLQREDLIWSLGLLICRLQTGAWPLSNQDGGKITKIIRNDFDQIWEQLDQISREGIVATQSTPTHCFQVANSMLMCQNEATKKFINLDDWESTIHHAQKNLVVDCFSQLLSEVKQPSQSYQNSVEVEKALMQQSLALMPDQDRSQPTRRIKKKIESEEENSAFRYEVNEKIRQIKRYIKLTVQPLFAIHRQLVSLCQQFDSLNPKWVTDEVYIILKIVEFLVVAENRRRCEIILMDQQAFPFSCVGALMDQLNQRINSTKLSELETMKLFKLRSRTAAYKRYLLKTIQNCNQKLVRYCNFLNEVLKNTQVQEGSLLESVQVLVSYWMDSLFWLDKCKNTAQRMSMAAQISEKTNANRVRQRIRDAAKWCTLELKGIIVASEQENRKQTKRECLKKREKLSSIYELLMLDQLMQKLRPGIFQTCSKLLQQVLSSCLLVKKIRLETSLQQLQERELQTQQHLKLQMENKKFKLGLGNEPESTQF